MSFWGGKRGYKREKDRERKMKRDREREKKRERKRAYKYIGCLSFAGSGTLPKQEVTIHIRLLQGVHW